MGGTGLRNPSGMVQNSVEVAHLLRELFGELVHDGLVDKNALGGTAKLAGVRHRGAEDACGWTTWIGHIQSDRKHQSASDGNYVEHVTHGLARRVLGGMESEGATRCARHGQTSSPSRQDYPWRPTRCRRRAARSPGRCRRTRASLVSCPEGGSGGRGVPSMNGGTKHAWGRVEETSQFGTKSLGVIKARTSGGNALYACARLRHGHNGERRAC